VRLYEKTILADYITVYLLGKALFNLSMEFAVFDF